MTKHRTLWWIYFAFLAMVNLLGIIFIPFYLEETTLLDALWSVISVLGLVGLIGYIKQIRIGSPIIWKLILVAELTLYIGFGISDYLSDPEFQESFKMVEYVGLMALMFLLFTPYWYALFQYGFRSNALWNTSEA